MDYNVAFEPVLGVTTSKVTRAVVANAIPVVPVVPVPPVYTPPDPITISGFMPSVGSAVLANQPLVFELNLPAGRTFDRIVVWVMYPELNGQAEVAYADGITASFSGSSKTVDVGLKRTFTILRNGGWPARPVLFVHANTDQGGVNV